MKLDSILADFKDVSTTDRNTVNELKKVTTVDQWNKTIKKLQDVTLRATIESNGAIVEVIK